MVLVLKCLFSKFKKYFLFFSPSLCQRPLHLIMAPRVCRWTTFSNCNFFFSNSLYIVVLLVSDKSFSSSFLCRDVMTDSRFVSLTSFCLSYVLRVVLTLNEFASSLYPRGARHQPQCYFGIHLQLQ